MREDIIKEFEDKIGYTFENKQNLITALTHSSYANEKRLKKYKCNERLEFLGDAVLELVSSQYIFTKFSEKPEGEMSRIRASYVCEPTLALCAREMNLGKFILLGKGEDKTGGRQRDSVLSDAMEATIGAVYLDGGFDAAKEYVDKFVLNDIESKKMFYDSKTILQEIVQGMHKTLEYDLISESGPDHDKTFTVATLIEGEVVSTATGHTKKKAEQAAAYQSILSIRAKKEKR